MKFVFYFILLVFICLCVFAFKNRKRSLINYSLLDEQIIQVYKNIIINNKQLTTIRVVSIILLILGIIGIIILLFCYLYYHIDIRVLTLIIFCGVLIAAIVSVIYSKRYKNDIVKKAIESYDSNLHYSPNKGITREKYQFANFEAFDKFHSEDLIEGTILNQSFVMSDVHTSVRSDDEDDSDTTIFKGAVAYVNLNKNINSFIYIINNQLKLFNNDYYMTIDNEAFEKKYDVYSDNQVLAMRLLTPSVTNSILDLEKKTGIYTEIKIYHDVVYFRFYTGDMFNPIIFNVNLEARNLALSIQLLMSIKDIMSNILTAMMEVID